MADAAPDGNVTLYQRLAEELAAAIRGGAWRPGARLPSVRAMAAERGLDPNTVNRAYLLLARWGLVEAHARCGTVVREPGPVPSRPRPAGPAEGQVLRLATTTSTADSGLLDAMWRG